MTEAELAVTFGKTGKESKIGRYGWKVKDERGRLELLNKNLLKAHPAYQRHLNITKARKLASAWSWIACGAICVGQRGDEYWIIDGQHRVEAAKKRSDISLIPCIVFDTECVEQEAKGFLDANTTRNAVRIVDKFRANLACGEEVALYVQAELARLNITAKQNAKRPLELHAVGWAMRRASENRESFSAVIELASQLCANSPIHERLLEGLYYIHTNSKDGLLNSRLRERILKIGQAQLLEAANRASAFFARGGAKIWAAGMLEEINKGLRNKIVLKNIQ